MGRNIIVCCDGTSNEFGNRNSNVVKLVTVLPLNNSNQLSFYDPGVGTLADPNASSWLAKKWSILRGLAFGYGLTRNVSEAYEYLMRTYQEGDKVFLFGFSRGAYTVRVLAGMLHCCGLLDEGSENLIPYALRLFKNSIGKDGHRLAAEFKETFSRICEPYFMGVWDTVSSVGWINSPVHFPFSYRDPDIAIIRHAVSIDERRVYFRQNLFAEDVKGQDCRQVWFPGVHGDVGGGDPEPECGLSKNALKWMVDEARTVGMAVDQSKYDEVIPSQTTKDFVAPSAAGTLHTSLKNWWWIAEFLPHRCNVPSGKGWVEKWQIPLGRRRFVPEGSLIDPSVDQRMKDKLNYRPSNLPKSFASREAQPVAEARHEANPALPTRKDDANATRIQG